MSIIGDSIIPCILCLIFIYGVFHRVPVFDVFLRGAASGFKTSIKILPALIGLMTCIAMFSASGALDVITKALSPLCQAVGFPREVVPLALLRPISGSGSLAIFENLMTNYGPDSFAGRVASVLQGSTETTFYTIAVYYSAVQIKKTRHTAASALLGDLTGFLVSALCVRYFFGV